MNAKYLAEIKARCESATRGPWEVKTNRNPETTGEAWGWIKGPSENWCWTDRRNRSRHNAEFVAAARTDIPELLAEVERLERLYTRMSEDISAIAKDRDTLKKALELACTDLSDREYPPSNAEQGTKENINFYIHQAQQLTHKTQGAKK